MTHLKHHRYSFAPIVEAALLEDAFRKATIAELSDRHITSEHAMSNRDAFRTAMYEAMGVGARTISLILNPVIEDQTRQLREFVGLK